MDVAANEVNTVVAPPTKGSAWNKTQRDEFLAYFTKNGITSISADLDPTLAGLLARHGKTVRNDIFNDCVLCATKTRRVLLTSVELIV
jgi:hypothetical protein